MGNAARVRVAQSCADTIRGCEPAIGCDKEGSKVDFSVHDVQARGDRANGSVRVRLLAVGVSALALTAMAATQAAAMSWRPVTNLTTPLVSSAAPTVGKLAPGEGPLIGGVRVLIKGTHLDGASAVRFGSTEASFTVKSATEIYATEPAGEGTVDVTVTTPNGTSPVNPGDRFSYIATPPAIDEVTPSSAPEKYGQRIVIKGSGFTGATAVDFGSTGAEFTVESPTVINAREPVGTGTVNVTVTTPEGTSAITPADEFTYTGRPPQVNGISPKKIAAAGGETIGVGGTNFLGASAVEVGDLPATSFTVNSATSISVTVPPEKVGKVEITVTTPYGVSGVHHCSDGEVCPVLLEFASPTIVDLSPSSGSEGTVVTVTGSGFAAGSTESEFFFGTRRATSVNCASTTECTVTAPHGTGTVRVKETVMGTNITTPATSADEFTYD
jgi:IPT/TIG domain